MGIVYAVFLRKKTFLLTAQGPQILKKKLTAIFFLFYKILSLSWWVLFLCFVDISANFYNNVYKSIAIQLNKNRVCLQIFHYLK